MSTTSAKSEQLRSLIRLLADASESVIQSWEAEEATSTQEQSSEKVYLQGSPLPSKELFEARRTVVGAVGMVMDLVQEPQSRLMEICSQYYEARALHIAVEKRVADLLADADPTQGVPLLDLSHQTGIKEQKLGRVLRCLCTVHVFVEVRPDHFANSLTSKSLIGNDFLRAWIMSMGQIQYSSSNKLPEILFDPVRGQSESDLDCAFQEAAGTKLTWWEWLRQPIQNADGSTGPRPDLEIFNLAMIGGGRVFGPPLYGDYPWATLGPATVVDVGGGIGGMSLDLAKKFPNLKFVVQDRSAVISQARAVWQRELPDALESQRTQLMGHDFFAEQPVKGAEIYNLRYILHDWDDEACVRILSSIRPALVGSPNSRILVCDQVMNTTCGSPSISSAPAPLLANYGYAVRFAHMRDLNMMAEFNGRERTPEDLQTLAKRAGLQVSKIWPCRGLVWITELRILDA
ncbi:hypothetical protein EVG20_g3987 [Dentipellis fragilis]|uniref:O-methyltransferase C-terminal domain-containing protein n=1 Tax=Dentipellis fragilis TaxID=205917 RepID=A0A4Y9YYF2_9AGAM|nr:hypothetical protein EVG20_g3987 [Dentipellis fragilis]